VPLRLLARVAPLVLGAVAAALWLHRRQTEQPALRERAGEVPRRFGRGSIDIVTVVDDQLGAAR
jgi:hypothetical protein